VLIAVTMGAAAGGDGCQVHPHARAESQIALSMWHHLTRAAPAASILFGGRGIHSPDAALLGSEAVLIQGKRRG
jgi:hypothetical protein